MAAIIQAVPAEVAQEAYADLAAPAMQEGGRLVADIAKTIRLALFPFQLASAWQDRLSRYVDKAIRQVPEERRIAPMESILLPVAEKLRFQEEDNPLTKLYVNLLSRAMDGERIGEAHPAFVSVISQMAPDELALIQELPKNDYTLILEVDGKVWRTPSQAEVEGAVTNDRLSPEQRTLSRQIVFPYEKLNQPDMFKMFLDHLQFLGLVTWTGDPAHTEYHGFATLPRIGPRFHFIQLSLFGKLFYKACISQAQVA